MLTAEVGAYDVRGGERGSNYIDTLKPGETVTVHEAFAVPADKLGELIEPGRHRRSAERAGKWMDGGYPEVRYGIQNKGKRSESSFRSFSLVFFIVCVIIVQK